MILAALVTMLAVSAQASNSGVCNPEQSDCPPARVGGVPHWVSEMNDWFAHRTSGNNDRICNPEQSDCPPDRVGGTPQWVSDMNAWFEAHGAQQTPPFNDNTGE